MIEEMVFKLGDQYFDFFIAGCAVFLALMAAALAFR
jgi:hypothetical protein